MPGLPVQFLLPRIGCPSGGFGRYLVLTVIPRVWGFYGDVFRDITALSCSSGSVLGIRMNLASEKLQGQDSGGVVCEAPTGKRFPLELPIKIHKGESAADASGRSEEH